MSDSIPYKRRTPILPPKAWRESDGCSAVPDYHYRGCCKEHDWKYRKWGKLMGTAYDSRKLADKQLRQCMSKANREWLDEKIAMGEAVSGILAYLFRWSWRPWLWWVSLRLVGWRNFHPKGQG